MADTTEQNKEYLQQWAETYSDTDKITGNDSLEKDAPDSLNDSTTDIRAQQVLLNSSAAGTAQNYYLDPIPFTNLLGKIYTDILKNLSDKGIVGIAARTDALRMNRDNMDYTLFNPETENKDTLFPESEFSFYTDNSDGGESQIFYTGLNLLMPQYQRRVEVEDLNENFWVISLVLDAVLKTLWGPFGLIEVIKKLITRVNAIESFLGLNNISGIELLHGDSNDLYFDMYSRFNLNELSIKLKTNSGERVIKNFISPTNKTKDRTGTTNIGETRQELFDIIQAEICKDNKLYDSDLISNETPLSNSNSELENNYISLSTILDAINNRIMSDAEEALTKQQFEEFNYDNLGKQLKNFLYYLDPSNNTDDRINLDTNNVFTIEEIKTITEEAQKGIDVSFNEIESTQEISAINGKYEQAYNYIIGLSEEDKESLINQLKDLNLISKNDEPDLFSFFFSTTDVSLDIPYVQLVKADDDTRQQFLEYGNERITQIINDATALHNYSLQDNVNENSDEYKQFHAFYVSLMDEGLYLSSMFSYDNESMVKFYNFGVEDGSSGVQTVNLPTKFTEVKLIQLSDLQFKIGLQYPVIAASLMLKDISSLKNYVYKEKSILVDFFDITGNSEFDLQDTIALSRSILDYQTGAVDMDIQRRITTIINTYFSDEFLFTSSAVSTSGNSVIKGINFFNALFELIGYSKISEELSEDEQKNKLMSIFFAEYNSDNINLIKYKTTIITPTLNLVNLIATVSQQLNTKTNGYDVKPTDGTWLKQTITTQEYGLFGNIIIFLYDKQYYEYKRGNPDIEEGLYFTSSDLYDNSSKPLLKRSLLNDNGILPLFLGRDDLFNGEIIQLRLTQKQRTKLNNFGNKDEIIKPNQIDFKKLMSAYRNDTISDNFSNCITDKIYPTTFLSLHNCFANNLGNYNFRTTLFFKDTTPFVDESNDEMPASLDDWFRNGIVCTYFRPKEVATPDGPRREAYVKYQNLKIHASMIAKNEPYVDNSFILEFISPFSGENNNDSSSYQRQYTFTKECAYFAAMRDNLIFYSSPPRNECGQFIYTPGKMLRSPNMKPHIDTIQTSKTTTYIPNDADPLNWYCLDVLDSKKQRQKCTLDDIKDMLYRNASGKFPLQVEAVFGRRESDNYVKQKKLRYIVVDREKGTRHITNGPTTVALSISEGYLHSSAITSKVEVEHQYGKITWYKKEQQPDGTKMVEAFNEDGSLKNQLSNDGIYGVHRVQNKTVFGDTFMVRFYSSAEKGDGPTPGVSTFSEYKDGAHTHNRRPIFSTAYFFGIDDSGKQTEEENS